MMKRINMRAGRRPEAGHLIPEEVMSFDEVAHANLPDEDAIDVMANMTTSPRQALRQSVRSALRESAYRIGAQEEADRVLVTKAACIRQGLEWFRRERPGQPGAARVQAFGDDKVCRGNMMGETTVLSWRNAEDRGRVECQGLQLWYTPEDYRGPPLRPHFIGMRIDDKLMVFEDHTAFGCAVRNISTRQALDHGWNARSQDDLFIQVERSLEADSSDDLQEVTRYFGRVKEVVGDELRIRLVLAVTRFDQWMDSTNLYTEVFDLEPVPYEMTNWDIFKSLFTRKRKKGDSKGEEEVRFTPREGAAYWIDRVTGPLVHLHPRKRHI